MADPILIPLRGTPVVPGLALGPVLRARTDVSPDAIAAFNAAGPVDEETALAQYDAAAAAVATGFADRAAVAVDAAAEVLTASAALTRDKGLRKMVRKHLADGDPLVASVDASVGHFAGLFTNMGGVMADRVTDLHDIGRRITAHVVGEPEPGVPDPTEPSVLVAADLAPSDTAGLAPALVLALVTERGGSTSHTAIIARQLGIPCVVGVPGALALADGVVVLVDGGAGTIEPEPDETDAHERVAADAAAREELARWSGPARTSDGVAVKLLANVADAESAEQAASGPVEGVGLFRTELCFLNTSTEPSVDEQAAIYARVLAPFGPGRYVVVRTLDAGSDKPIAYATRAGEENPALGVRGLRLSFDNPGLLDRQLAAIAMAAKDTGVETWVMAPMVATVAEAAAFGDSVRSHGLKPGVMVEIPSAAILAEQLLEVVDFLSIGTNDLTQYTMAADRMASDLAHLSDAWQPAVLRLISMTAEAGRRTGKPVGVCGEAAADPLLAAVLVGMGVGSLSMAAGAVRPVGAQLARVSSSACDAAAEAALGAADPVAARAAVREALSER